MKSEEFSMNVFIPDEERVLNIFRSIRWVNGLYCPKRGSKNVVKYGFVRKTPLRRYICRKCEKHFTDLTGTIFSNKRIPLGECPYILSNLDKKKR